MKNSTFLMKKLLLAVFVITFFSACSLDLSSKTSSSEKSSKKNYAGIVREFSSDEDIYLLEQENGEVFRIKSQKIHLENFVDFKVSLEGERKEGFIAVDYIDIVSRGSQRREKREGANRENNKLDHQDLINNSQKDKKLESTEKPEEEDALSDEQEKKDQGKEKISLYEDPKRKIYFQYPKIWGKSEKNNLLEFSLAEEKVVEMKIVFKDKGTTLSHFVNLIEGKENSTPIKLKNFDAIRIKKGKTNDTTIYLTTNEVQVLKFTFLVRKGVKDIENQMAKNDFYELLESLSTSKISQEISKEDEKEKVKKSEDEKEEIYKKVANKITKKIADLSPENIAPDNWKVIRFQFAGEKYVYVETEAPERERMVLFSFSIIDDVVFLHRRAYFKKNSSGAWELSSGKDLAANLEKISFTDFDRQEEKEEGVEDMNGEVEEKSEEQITKEIQVDLEASREVEEGYLELSNREETFSLLHPNHLYWRRFTGSTEYLDLIVFSKEEIEEGQIEFDISVALVGNHQQDLLKNEIVISVSRDEKTTFLVGGREDSLDVLEVIARSIRVKF